MTKIRAVIVDDELLARCGIRQMLAAHAEVGTERLRGEDRSGASDPNGARGPNL